MLITFKSKADADVLMFGEVGQAMLAAMGKDPQDRQGIVTQEQIPMALSHLRAAAATSKASAGRAPDDEDDPDAPRGMALPVSFHQRVVPLVEMLERAQREAVVVTWEATG